MPFLVEYQHYDVADFVLLVGWGLFTFIGASLAVILFLMKTLGEEDALETSSLLWFVGIGPLLLSWILRNSYALFPRFTDCFYSLLCLSLFLVMVMVGWSRRHCLRDIGTDAISRLSAAFHAGRSICLVLLLLLVSSLILTILFPISDNDPSVYLTQARIIYEEKSIKSYPFTQAHAETGYYGPSSHPLAYHMLIVWFRQVAGRAFPLLFKVTAWYFSLCTVFVLLNIASRPAEGIFSAILLLTTPIYFIHTVISHIDAMRIYALVVCILFSWEVVQRASTKKIWLLGITCGLALWCHGLSILLAPLVVAACLFARNLTLREKFRALLVVGGISFLFVGPRYIENIIYFGDPIRVVIPVREVESLNYKHELKLRRNLNGSVQAPMVALFRGFIEIKRFGFSYFLMALGAVIAFRSKAYPSIPETRGVFPVRIAFGVVIYILGVSLATVLMGTHLFIMNPRYLMTVQPFVAMVGGVFLARWYEKTRRMVR